MVLEWTGDKIGDGLGWVGGKIGDGLGWLGSQFMGAAGDAFNAASEPVMNFFGEQWEDILKNPIPAILGFGGALFGVSIFSGLFPSGIQGMALKFAAIAVGGMLLKGLLQDKFNMESGASSKPTQDYKAGRSFKISDMDAKLEDGDPSVEPA